jgi:histidine ammonia-lyase
MENLVSFPEMTRRKRRFQKQLTQQNPAYGVSAGYGFLSDEKRNSRIFSRL